MKHKVQLLEYSSKALSNLSEPTENALFDIADSLATHYKSQVIKCSKNRSGDVIVTTSSFVGVIDVDNSLTIEIHPKIYESNDIESLRNLFYMLGYSGRLHVSDKRLSGLSSDSGGFFEMLISMFAEELLNKVQNSAHHEYTEEQKNRTYLRGKLIMGDHLKTNGLLANKFYTQTDEFTANNSLNQLLKFVSLELYKLTDVRTNKKQLRKCLTLFDEVDTVRVTHAQAGHIHLNRLNKRFENLLTISKLFLNHQTLVAKSGYHDSWTMLIDMNVLFEEFIAKALEKSLRTTQYKVITQGPRNSFVKNLKDDRPAFTTKPDISITLNNNVYKIADTKYKKLIEDDAKYGVSQVDLYQMFAYSRRYKAQDITLIYPKTNQVEPHTLELPDETRVHIRSINLSRDIRKEIKIIEQEVLELFTTQQKEATAL